MPAQIFTVLLACKIMLAISIVDSDVGITEDHLPQIFHRFFGVDEAHSTRGFGLGLPIVQRIIQLHGGVLDVQSDFGTGT
ncbi:MAG: sensor histidine kinase [Chloroflexota bacterium]